MEGWGIGLFRVHAPGRVPAGCSSRRQSKSASGATVGLLALDTPAAATPPVQTYLDLRACSERGEKKAHLIWETRMKKWARKVDDNTALI